MKALTIRQPWAWAIFHAGKDIENRDWPTRLRGRIAIHAAKGMTRDEYESALFFIQERQILEALPFRYTLQGEIKWGYGSSKK